MALSTLARTAFFSLFFTTILAMNALTAKADVTEEKRVALVIGNNAYAHATPLDNPRNDAQAIADALARLNFDTVLSFDLDQRGMQRALGDFEERIRDADVALLYYAGHGLQTHGRNYLVSTDADLRRESDLHFNTIDLQIILDFMQDPDRTSIIILDACRDNPLADELARSLPKSRSNGVARGLAKVESGVGTLVAFATAPGAYALDGTGAHSPFGQSLLQHIETPGLEVRQLFSRVRDDVYRQTDGVQIPWDNSSLRSDFYFNPAIQLAAAPPQDPPQAPQQTLAPTETAADTTKAEYLFWETIKNDQTPENYAEFLRLFPESIFAGLAQQRLAAYLDRHAGQVALEDRPAPEVAARPVTETEPQTVAALTSPEAYQGKARITSVAMPAARKIAHGWRRRAYTLRGNNVHGCRGTGKETARVGDWTVIDPALSSVRLQSRYTDGVSTFSAKTFDIAASLGVRAEDGEILLVESKKAVGRAHAWCTYKALSKALFSDMLAGTDYFADQRLTTTHTGFTRSGWMEFAFGLVTADGADGVRNCMTFMGFQGRRRIDGFFCRDIGVPIDASEVDGILARLKAEGVIG